MNAEEVAQRYAYSRPGFDLVGYAGVGLPVYWLTVRTLTLRHKKISPLEEFVLRSINAGLDNTGQLSDFLGIKEKVIKSILVNLFSADDITLSGEPGIREQVLRLTQKGAKTLESTLSDTPEERSLQIHFDGLLRMPILLERWSLYSLRELRDEGLIEIPALPATPPQLKDIALNDFEKIIQQASKRTGEIRMDILALKAVEKRERFFLRSVALKFLSKDKQSLHIAFAIDGRLSEAHEKAFASKEGPRKCGTLFTTPILSEDISSIIPADVAELLPHSQEEVERLKQTLRNAESELERANADIENAETHEKKVAAEVKKSEVTERVSSSRRALQEIPIRFLSVYDHPIILQESLTDSQERLMIISPWIRQDVVDTEFINKLRALLNRGVRIYIGYGIKDKSKNDEVPLLELRKLSKQFSNMSFVNIGHTHAKILISDQSRLVVTSFNWLSFRGDPNRTFRDEQGVLITHSGKVEEKFQEQFQLHFDKDK